MLIFVPSNKKNNNSALDITVKSVNMKRATMQEELINRVKADMTYNEALQLADEMTDNIINDDKVFYSIDKHFAGYGTWKANISMANEYHFGDDIANILTSCGGVITHDEDKEFTLEDFREEILDSLTQYIYDKSDEKQ